MDTNKSSPIIICYFCILFCVSTLIFNFPTFALPSCEFPAIFNFGDSNSDTGAMSAAFIPSNPPYGETHFHMPAGRFSDGRLIIDFIAESLNKPYLSPYLDSMGTNFTNGANFATGGATIGLPSSIIPNGLSSPFFLEVQFLQFLQFKLKSQILRKQGGVFAKLMPKEDYFPKALYIFDIGQNDIGDGLSTNKSIQQVNASIPGIIDQFSANIQSMYKLGARTFWIHNSGPIGCLPYILVNFPSEKDEAGCAKTYNKLIEYLNLKLKESIIQLRNNYPLASFVYVDIYSVKYSLFKSPHTNGFELPQVACCGYGGKYNYSNEATCGDKIEVNGREIVIDSCNDPSIRVVWDGVHYTEAANNFVFNQISTGSFSHPPIPLNMSCNKY